MSGKNQFPTALNWQSTSPITGFLPLKLDTANKGSVPSGTLNGTMASTNTIYSQILDISRMDNVGAEVNWSGTPTGTLTVLVSNSGINFSALTFNPQLTQPSGSADGYALDLNQVPFKYLLFKYVNSTGSGTLTVYLQSKDLN